VANDPESIYGETIAALSHAQNGDKLPLALRYGSFFDECRKYFAKSSWFANYTEPVYGSPNILGIWSERK
jgi:hypothetical protein